MFPFYASLKHQKFVLVSSGVIKWKYWPKNRFYKNSYLKNFLRRPKGLQLYRKENQTQVFSCEYCEHFKNTCFEKQPQTAASESWWNLTHYPISKRLYNSQNWVFNRENVLTVLKFMKHQNNQLKKAIILTLSWWRSLSYVNQSIDLLCKLMDWCLYDRDLP